MPLRFQAPTRNCVIIVVIIVSLFGSCTKLGHLPEFSGLFIEGSSSPLFLPYLSPSRSIENFVSLALSRLPSTILRGKSRIGFTNNTICVIERGAASSIRRDRVLRTGAVVGGVFAKLRAGTLGCCSSSPRESPSKSAVDIDFLIQSAVNRRTRGWRARRQVGRPAVTSLAPRDAAASPRRFCRTERSLFSSACCGFTT